MQAELASLLKTQTKNLHFSSVSKTSYFVQNSKGEVKKFIIAAINLLSTQLLVLLAVLRSPAILRFYTNASNKNGLKFVLRQQQRDLLWKSVQVRSQTFYDAKTRYAPLKL